MVLFWREFEIIKEINIIKGMTAEKTMMCLNLSYDFIFFFKLKSLLIMNLKNTRNC